MKSGLAKALVNVQQLKDENNKMTDKLTAKSQKCNILYSDLKTLKVENTDLNERRLKMVLSQLDII